MEEEYYEIDVKIAEEHNQMVLAAEQSNKKTSERYPGLGTLGATRNLRQLARSNLFEMEM